MKQLSFLLVACGSAAVLSFAACGSSDKGKDTPADAGAEDTNKPTDAGLPTAELVVLSKDRTEIPADLSCKGGMPDAGPDASPGDADVDGGAMPRPGDLVDVPFVVTEFGGGGSDVVVGADVDIFYKNTLAGAADAKGKTDAMGTVTLKAPFAQPFAYRVNANATLKTFVYFDSDAITQTSGKYSLTAITESKYNQFALAITGKPGFLIAAGKGIYSARVKDCQNRDVANAVVELQDETGAPLPVGTGDADMRAVSYLSDQDLPSIGRTFTSHSGLIAVVNVPATSGGKKLKAIAKGLFGGSKTLQTFASADLEITAAAVNFRPLVVR